MTEAPSTGPYLRHNNARLDMPRLEQRLEEILADQPALPAASRVLPSLQPYKRPSILRRLLIRVKASPLISQWLPRHPVLYRRARTLYHATKRLAGR